MSHFIRTLICLNRTATKTAFSDCASLRNGSLLRNSSTFSTSTERNKRSEEEEELDKPIKFSTSPAAKWKASTSRTGDRNPRPWFEPYVVSVSLAVFLVYFLFLREESDIDEEFSKSLYNRIQGLEEQQLRIALEFNKERGLSGGEIENRLKEIKEEEKTKPEM